MRNKDLPAALDVYFRALEGKFDLASLGVAVCHDVRISLDGTEYTNGIKTVRALIRARRQQLRGAVLEITRVRNCSDGSLKVDFHVIPKGGPIKFNVPAMYRLSDSRIAKIFEAWPPLMLSRGNR
jgi:hypothetical protein